MKSITLIALILLVCGPLFTMQKKGFIIVDDDNSPQHIVSEPPRLAKDQLPSQWFWNDVNGKSYLTIVRNHHFPQYCGGCYSMATSSTFSDRIKIARDGAFPDVNIAPQVILSCTPNHGCHGGSMAKTYEYIHQYGITDETCSGYRAKGHENGAPCTDELKCSVCDADGNCEVPDSYRVYYIEEYGQVKGEEAMMSEIYHRGPISCMLAADPIDDYTSGIAAIYLDNYEFDHVISVVGYGNDEDGTPYWLVRNSWGSFWGEDGFFRVARGNNSLGIETTCYWVVPKDTWTDDIRNYSKKATAPESFSSEEEIVFPDDSTVETEHADCVEFDPKFENFVSQSGETPFTKFPTSKLPDTFSWGNVNGVSYLSFPRGENNPNFCASCWAEATTSALADRIMVTRNSTFPHIGISPQVVLNCKAGGDCSGGDPLTVYEFAYNHGIPEESCQGYLSKERSNATCGGEYLCLNCQPPAPSFADSPDPHNCTIVTDYRNWKVSDFGVVSGVTNMKKAIFQDGPIVCSIHATSQLEKYTAGIFSQSDDSIDTTDVNHVVSVVGWDVDTNTGVEYWLVRNSWGTHWGEHGFFKVPVGFSNLGIENKCFWATPIVDDVMKSRFDYEDANQL